MTAACLSLSLCLLCPAGDRRGRRSRRFWYPFYAREAAGYEIFRDEERKERLEVRKQPLLTWTNSENYMGAVFIWEFAGRPEMIGCIGSHQNPKSGPQQFLSRAALAQLAAAAAPVKFGGGSDVWQVTEPGLQLAAAEGAPEPGRFGVRPG